MSEQDPTGGGNQPGTEGQVTPPSTPELKTPATPAEPAGEQHEGAFSQEQVDRFNAAERRKAQAAEARAVKAEADLAKRKEADLSEQEKVTKTAVDAAVATEKAGHAAELLQTELRARLASKGYPMDWAANVIQHGKPADIDALDGAIDQCKTDLEWFRPTTAAPPGEIQGGGPTGGNAATATITWAQAQDPKFYSANEELVETCLREGRVR